MADKEQLVLEDKGGLWDSLCDQLLCQVFAQLPVSTLVRASLVCQRWRSIISSPFFIHFHSKTACSFMPWFFLYGINFLVPHKSQIFGFDPQSRTWHSLPFPQRLRSYNTTSLSASSGLMHVITGGTYLQICHRHDLSAQFLPLTAPMSYCRADPVVGYVEDPTSGNYRVIACGGSSMFEDEDLAVEIFESHTGTWEICSGLPAEFKGSSSGHRTNSVIHKGRFFVHDINSGSTAALDIHAKTWSSVHVLRPVGVKYSYLVSCDESLLLAGACSTKRGAFAVWKVKEDTMDYTEIGRMPQDLFHRFVEMECEEEDETVNLTCIAAGQLLYIFRASKYNGYVVALCRFFDSKCCWMRVPDLSRYVNRFDNVIGLCAPVTLRSCFEHPNPIINP